MRRGAWESFQANEPFLAPAPFTGVTEPNDELPDELIRDLRAVYRRRVEVPAAVAVTIHLAARRRLRSRWRRLAPLAGLAAAACVAAGVWVTLPTPAPAVANAGPMDLNRDGRVDVLDAFKLAREVRDGNGTDLTSDRAADRRRVDSIAQLAVALPAGGGS